MPEGRAENIIKNVDLSALKDVDKNDTEIIKKITRRTRDTLNKTGDTDAVLLIALILGVKLD